MFEPDDEDPIYTSVRGTLAACSDGVSYVAVSGGSDSLALAFIAAKAAARAAEAVAHRHAREGRHVRARHREHVRDLR